MHWPQLRGLDRALVVALGAGLGSGATNVQPLPAAMAEGPESSPRYLEELIGQPITKHQPRRRRARPKPVLTSGLGPVDFKRELESASPRLGSISIGRANRGYLFNASKLEDGPFWRVMEPARAYGTEESVQAIEKAIREVNVLFPSSPKLVVGHLSRERGGWLRPHRSHQSGRDVDLGFYYTFGEGWYKHATADNFDAPRNWALLSALLKSTDVEYIFVSRALHDLLRDEAESVQEDAEFIQRVFDGPLPKQQPILRHARGHQTHFHVRFASPVAVDNARRAQRLLGRRAFRSASLLNMLKARKLKAKRRQNSR